MTFLSYQNFIGLDIGKFEIVAAVHGAKQTYRFANDEAGWKVLHQTLKAELNGALVTLETTGGYECGERMIRYLTEEIAVLDEHLQALIHQDPLLAQKQAVLQQIPGIGADAMIKGGRRENRTALFMAAMAARNSHSRFKEFYQSLIQRGKKPIVALVALMRKLIVVANAKLRDFYLTLIHPAQT